MPESDDATRKQALSVLSHSPARTARINLQCPVLPCQHQWTFVTDRLALEFERLFLAARQVIKPTQHALHSSPHDEGKLAFYLGQTPSTRRRTTNCPK